MIDYTIMDEDELIKLYEEKYGEFDFKNIKDKDSDLVKILLEKLFSGKHSSHQKEHRAISITIPEFLKYDASKKDDVGDLLDRYEERFGRDINTATANMTREEIISTIRTCLEEGISFKEMTKDPDIRKDEDI